MTWSHFNLQKFIKITENIDSISRNFLLKRILKIFAQLMQKIFEGSNQIQVKTFKRLAGRINLLSIGCETSDKMGTNENDSCYFTYCALMKSVRHPIFKNFLTISCYKNNKLLYFINETLHYWYKCLFFLMNKAYCVQNKMNFRVWSI